MNEIERATYAGLTISDKPALLDAKARGAEWVARDQRGNRLWIFEKEPKKLVTLWACDPDYTAMHAMEIDSALLPFIKWSDAEPVNIDIALAQIAEMESAAGNPVTDIPVSEKPLTWNERINQMTLEEKAIWLYNMDVCRVSSISIEECNSFRHCVECMKSMLASPYTEGEKK